MGIKSTFSYVALAALTASLTASLGLDAHAARKSAKSALVPCPATFGHIANPIAPFNNENVVMRGQFSQFPEQPAIPGSHLSETLRTHGVPGDPLFPQTDGDYIRVRFVAEPKAAYSEAELPSPARKTSAQLSAAERQTVVANFTRQVNADLPLTEPMLKQMIEAAQSEPRTVQQALRAYDTGQASLSGPISVDKVKTLSRPEIVALPGRQSRAANLEVVSGGKHIANAADQPGPFKSVELATAGENRYFWFTPRGQKTPVAARVLDIHVGAKSSHFMIEWLPEAGAGVREVGMLTLDELKSIPALANTMRMDAAKAFFQNLTPNQIFVQELASKLGISARGHSDFLRAPGVDKGTLVSNKMANLSHYYVRDQVEKNFGDISDLMTSAERSNSNWHVSDVFSRLSPEYVLQRFGKKGGFKYAWGVTEDGQLKIVPLGAEESNLRPQLLRLGHARKVYSSGMFTIGENGALDVTLRTADYMSVDSRLAGSVESPRQINQFVEAVFASQARARVRGIGSAPVDSWSAMRFDAESGRYVFRDDIGASGAHAEPRAKTSTKSEFAAGGSSDDDVREFMRANFPTDLKAQSLKWDSTNPKAVPLEFEQWMKETKANPVTPAQNKLAWAHYILGTHADMSFAAVASSRRKLSSTFHPRTMTNESAVVPQAINRAWMIFKENFKNIQD